MPLPAIFGVESSGLSVVIDLIGLAILVLYFALIYWTYSDARRRIADPMLVGCATIAALFPFIGPLVYVILRPPETLDDVAERELEMQTAEARLSELARSHCAHCDYPIESEYIRCPSCTRKLKERCPTCARALEPTWPLCPFCETEVKAAPKRRRSRRRSPEAEQEVAPEAIAAQEEPAPAPEAPAPAATPAGAGRARRPPTAEA